MSLSAGIQKSGKKYILMSLVLGLAVKRPVRMPTPQFGVLRFDTWFRLQLRVGDIEFLAPSFSLIHSQLLWTKLLSKMYLSTYTHISLNIHTQSRRGEQVRSSKFWHRAGRDWEY